MKTIDIPGWGRIVPHTLALDLNGTLTESGVVIPGVFESMRALQNEGIEIFVLSGDTRGTLHETFAPVQGVVPVVTRTAAEKREFVEGRGAEHVVSIGNGNIDVEMFRVAKLSICTVQAEGASTQAMLAADIVVPGIHDAFGLLLDPRRLIATLRS